MILVHNHPSGHPEPSTEDKRVTERLVQVGQVIGIQVLDHIIIGDMRYYSFKEHDLM
jgi:DNA repair protein RadC